MRYQISAGPDACIIHFDVELPHRICRCSGQPRDDDDRQLSDDEDDLVNFLLVIPGILGICLERYQVKIIKGKLFAWEPIHEAVIHTICEWFGDSTPPQRVECVESPFGAIMEKMLAKVICKGDREGDGESGVKSVFQDVLDRIQVHQAAEDDGDGDETEAVGIGGGVEGFVSVHKLPADMAKVLRAALERMSEGQKPEKPEKP